MEISEAAQRHHDRLFPEHESGLPRRTMTWVGVFDNLASGEVLDHGGLAERIRLLVQVASLIASHTVGEYRVILGAALTFGVTPVEVKQIVDPRSLNAIAAVNDVVPPNQG